MDEEESAGLYSVIVGRNFDLKVETGLYFSEAASVTFEGLESLFSREEISKLIHTLCA